MTDQQLLIKVFTEIAFKCFEAGYTSPVEIMLNDEYENYKLEQVYKIIKEVSEKYLISKIDRNKISHKLPK